MRKLLLSLVTIVFATSLFAKDISVGYVLVGPSNDGGWSMRHSDGFKSLVKHGYEVEGVESVPCLLYTSPSPRDRQKSRMPSSA